MNEDDAAPLIRSVSKTGSLGLSADETKALSARLSPEEAVELYVLIRNGAHRLEREWREEFISHFPQAEEFLPNSLDPDFEPDSLFEIIDRTREAADPGEWYDTFEELLEQATERGVDLSELTKDGLTLREYAERSGDKEFVTILDEFPDN